MQFLGNIDAKVDNKGRVFVPAPFRRILGEETSLVLRLTADPGFVKLYPVKEWEKINEELKSKLNLWNKRDQAVYRQFTAMAENVELDANGRMLLSKRSMETLGIDSDVVFAGVGDYIELWSRDRFEATMLDEGDLEAALEEIMK